MACRACGVIGKCIHRSGLGYTL
uniref:Uncharacterized protein n=1 Tax=Anguilla anguilla TaxID=7936 RepID=A0A0E9T2P6_ANGAN